MRTAWALWVAAAATLAVITPFVVARFGGITRYLYCLFVFSLQIQVALNVAYRSQFKPAGVRGISLTPTLMFAGALMAIWIFNPADSRRRRPLSGSWIWPGAAFIAVSALSIVNTTVKMWTAVGLVEILSLFAIGTVAYHYGSTREGIRTTRTVLIVSLLVQSCILLLQNVTGVAFTLNGGSLAAARGLAVGGSGRFTGTMITPSESATFLVMCLIVAVAALVSPIEKRWKPPVWAAVALGSVALVLSMTRSAWAGLVIGTIAVVTQTRRRFTVKLGFLVALSVIVGLGLVIAWSGVSQRVEAAQDDWSVRWNLNLIAWEMIKANPLVGVGLNNATQVVNRYAPLAPLTLNQWGAAWIFIPHNQFLLVTAETGVLGLLAFVWMLGSSLRAARFAARSRDPFLSEAGSILVAMHLALIWALNLDFVAGAQTYVLMWFLMGSAHGLRRCSEAETENQPATVRGRDAAIPPAPSSFPRYRPTLAPSATQSSWTVSR